MTQNIDDLHEQGGAAGVIHMHGELARALCAGCGARWDAPREMHPDDACPACGARRHPARRGLVRRDALPDLDEIVAALAGGDLFVAIGTSGSVYPAAGFVAEARAAGAADAGAEPRAPPTLPARSTRCVSGRRREVVPAWVDEVLGR